jgi:hydroxyacylglutathione hydrolase
VPSTLGEEKATNPFLRCTEAEVVAAALRQNATVGGKKTAIIKFIREWRNNF